MNSSIGLLTAGTAAGGPYMITAASEVSTTVSVMVPAHPTDGVAGAGHEKHRRQYAVSSKQ
jgi:hypothetical protein